MNNLYLLHHGLPGIGVKGIKGEKGEKGNSIYFGYIEDFFDGVTVNTAAIVRIAKRLNDNGYNEFIDYEFSEINKYIKLIKKNLDTSFYSEEYIKKYKENESVYYTGMLFDASLLQAKGDFDVCENFLVNANILDSSSNIIYLEELNNYENNSNLAKILIGNNITLKDITESTVYVNNIQKNYYDLYGFTSGDVKTLIASIMLQDTKKDIIITYDDIDVAREIGKINEYYMSYDKSILCDSSLYCYLDNNSNEIDVSNDLELPTIFRLYFITNENNEKYAQNVGFNYSKAKLSNGTLVDVSIFENLYKTYGNIHELNDKKIPYYAKSTFVDNDGKHYSIDSSLLFNYNDKPVTIQDIKKIKRLVGEKFEDQCDSYVSKVSHTLQLKYSNLYVGADERSIYYGEAGSADVFIPITLKKDFIAGDTIYFYTNKKDNEGHDTTLENKNYYMSVLTNELLECTSETLQSSAQLANPFEIQRLLQYYLNENKRIINFNELGVLFKNEYNEDSSLTKYYNNSISAIMSHNSNAAMCITCTSTCSNNDYLLFNSFNIDTSSKSSNTLFISHNKTTNNLNFKTDNLKFESLLVQKNCLDSNVENYSCNYDDNIILSDDFLKPIDTLYQYVNNENNTLLGVVLNENDYFYNNKLLHIYGYELYTNNLLIQSNCTSNSSIECILSFDTLQKQFVNDTTNSYIIYNQLTFDNESSVILEWDNKKFIYHNLDIRNDIVYAIYVDSTANLQDINSISNATKIFVSLNNHEIYTFALQNLKTGIYTYNEKTGERRSLEYREGEDGQITIKFSNAIQNLVSINKCYRYNIKANKANVQYENVYVGEYFIMAWASNGRIKKYSNFSKISVLVDKNLVLKGYDILVVGYGLKLIKEKEKNIIFKTSNTNVDECLDVSLFFDYGTDISINNVYFNNELIANDSYAINKWSKIKKLNNNEFLIDLSSNLPTILYYDIKNNGDSSIMNNYWTTLEEYMKSYCDDDNNNINEDCDLFKLLRNNVKLPSTTNRTILVTVEYTKISENNAIKYYENYNFVLPGFTDTRCLPTIDLKLYNSFEDLQNINTIQNGVLCNQFKTYLDVDISNLSEWDKYVDVPDISIDIEIKNMDSDLDYQKKYVIKNKLIHRSTIKPVHKYNYNEDDKCENYIALNTRYINDNENIYNLDSSNIEYYKYNFSNNSYVEINDTFDLLCDNTELPATELRIFVDSDGSTVNGSIGKKQYIFTDYQFGKYKKYASVEKGVNAYINISLNGITQNTIDNNKFRFKIEYENGNPIISNMYLRFQVSKIKIHYNDATFTAVVPNVLLNEASKPSILFKSTSVLDQNYTFISDILDVNINPISYVVCDKQIESELTNIQGTTKKYGSENQILEIIKFYDSSFYSDAEYVKTVDSSKFSSQNIRQTYGYDWQNSILYLKYFLDNIENIDIKNTNISNILTKINNKFDIKNDLNILLNNDNVENVSNTNVIVVYNSSLFTLYEENGINKFIYNDKYLLSSKYNQLNNKLPIYITLKDKINLRSKLLIDSMDIWNDEYQYSNRLDKDITFTGQLSMFGNGYMYLDESYDYGQYERAIIDDTTPDIELIRSNITKINNDNIECLSLQETKLYNDINISNICNISDINYVTYDDLYRPFNRELYRSLVYDIKMEYLYVKDNDVYPFRILNDFDYLLTRINEKVDQSSIIEKGNYENRLNTLQCNENDHEQRYYNNNRLPKSEQKDGLNGQNLVLVVPYSILYDLYPRVAYNTNSKTINILMLRKPTFEKDNDIQFSNEQEIKNSGYNLNKHYFLTIGDIKDIEFPYKK